MPSPSLWPFSMLIDSLILLGGLLLLAVSSDRFVLGACAIAHNLGITPMVVGLTVVALGTSAPEMLVSAMAALAGTPDMALGNVLGSNVANVALVVGASAAIMRGSARGSSRRLRSGS